MNRVQAHRTDIQKLAEKDKIKGGLKSIQDREPIGGGFTPFDKKSFAGDSNAGAGTDGGIDPEDPNSFAEPDPSDPDNPNNKGGTNNRDPLKDGPQDIDDLLDEEAGPTLPDDSVSDPFSGGSLNKITGLQDCDTGQCVTAHLDGRFDTPEGWDDPDTPPIDNGFRWRSGPSALLPGSHTARQEADAYLAHIGSGGSVVEETGFSIDDINTAQVSFSLNGSSNYTTFIYRFGCMPPANIIPDCTPPSAATEWPTDGCYDVAMIDGQVQINPYDSEAPASAREERSAATFCTSGGKKVVIRAAANGKTMMYPVTASGAPTGIVKVYNSDGTLSSAGDASQQNIDSQLPR